MAIKVHANQRPPATKWERVLHAVMEAIQRGDFRPGDRFYTLRELGAKYQVSTVTAQRVFRELVDRHVIVTSRRSGATVTGSAQTATIYVCLRNEVFANPARLDHFRAVDHFLTGVRQGAGGRFATIEPVALEFLKNHLHQFRGKPFLVHANVLLDVVDGKGMLNDATLKLFREALNPIIFNSFDRLEGVTQLIHDLQGGFQRLVDHLATRHKHIGCLMGYPGCVWFRPRLQGYLDGLYGNKLNFVPEWLKITSGLDKQEDFRALEAMLKGADRPTALVCANDMRALHALEYCLRHNIAVPDELAIVGSDNIPECAVSQPSLTTLDFCQNASGRQAADWLLKRLLGQMSEPVHKRIKPDLIVRDST